jgi:hypothetical protein
MLPFSGSVVCGPDEGKKIAKDDFILRKKKQKEGPQQGPVKTEKSGFVITRDCS